MPVSDPELRYATFTQVVDGVQTDFEVSFVGGYINPAHVMCVSVVVDPETGLVSDRQVHATEILGVDDDSSTVRVSPAVAAGRTIVIFRDTTKTNMLVAYSNGSILTKDNLDLANRQLLMLVQEILDNTNINTLSVQEAVETVVNLNELVMQIYNEVLEILNSGGIVSVAPPTYNFMGDGETTDFVLEGTSLVGASFYDTYVTGNGISPVSGFSILPNTPTSVVMRFAEAPGDGQACFVVVRGYAVPADEDPTPPITSLRIPIIQVPGTVGFVDETSEFGLLQCTNDDDVLVTLNEIPAVGVRLGNGSYVAIEQAGLGQVTVEVEAGATLVVPGGFLPATRAVGSTITAVVTDADTNSWLLGGDLAPEV